MKKNNIKLPENVITYEYTKILGLDNIVFSNKGKIMIDDFVFINALQGKLRLGNFVHISLGTSISTGESEVIIGDFGTVSQGCRIFATTDDFVDWGFGNSTLGSEVRNLKNLPVVLNDFSIIGANSVILPGVTIGEGASVGAGSVITKNLDPWGVYIGNKKVKDRNKRGILNNYEKFVKSLMKEDREAGDYFKSKLENMRDS